MKCFLPKLRKDGVAEVFNSGEQSILGAYSSGRLGGIEVLINRTPQWNERIGAYVLNFQGRVTMASVKNFQLENVSNGDDIILQFGRVGMDKFTMDFKHPLTPMQA